MKQVQSYTKCYCQLQFSDVLGEKGIITYKLTNSKDLMTLVAITHLQST